MYYNALGSILQQLLSVRTTSYIAEALTATVLILSRSWEQNYFYTNFMWALCKHDMIGGKINQRGIQWGGAEQPRNDCHMFCATRSDLWWVGLGKTTTFRLNIGWHEMQMQGGWVKHLLTISVLTCVDILCTEHVAATLRMYSTQNSYSY